MKATDREQPDQLFVGEFKSQTDLLGRRKAKRTKLGKKKGNKLTYKWKTRPYVHQLRAVKKLLSTGWGGALLMEPRTGKTKVAIDYMSILHVLGKVNRVIVFAPVGVMSVWEEELAVHCPVPYRLLIWDKKARKEDDLPRFGKDILDIVVTNYDAASTPPDWRRDRKTGEIAWFIPEKRRGRTFNRPVPKGTEGAIRLRTRNKGGRFGFQQKVKDWQPQLIILDESHRIKSPSARKSMMLHKLGPLADFRVLMTGTVVTKKKRIFDVYSQWKFLYPRRFAFSDGTPLDFSDFKDEFSVMTKRNGYPQWLRNKNEDRLHKLIHLDSYSVRREDCFDLPPITHQVIPVHLYESGEAYDQMAEDMVARIRTGEITEASIALVQGLRLRQISNGLAKTMPTEDHPEGRLVIIGREKLETLQDRLQDLMEAGEHVIIGAAFRGDISRIRKLCEQHKWNHWVVQGGLSNEERKRARLEFEKCEDGAVFIGQPAAASEGIDLRSAAITIWYSLPTSWVHYHQFTDRNALHSGPRFVEYLLADGIDHLVYQTLIEDGDVAKRMITSPERLLRDSGN